MTPAQSRLVADAAAIQSALPNPPRCRFCGMPDGWNGRGPLAEYPGWLPGVLFHDRCERETRQGGLD